MTRFFTAAAVALTLGMSVAPAFANTLEENMRNIARASHTEQCLKATKTFIDASNDAVRASYKVPFESRLRVMDEVDARQKEGLSALGNAFNDDTDCDGFLAKTAIAYVNESPLSVKPQTTP